MGYLLRGGTVIDPASQKEELADVLIEGDRIKEIAPPRSLSPGKAEIIDAAGCWVTPGLIDLHVHLREPGQEYKEDIASGTLAAVRGGFTTVVAMPNTKPPIDSGELIHYVTQRAQSVAKCRVLMTGAVTIGQQGQTLAPFGEMRAAGACAFTDDGHPVADAHLMRRALEYASDFGVPILSHSEDLSLSKNGHMNEGSISTSLGLRGIPNASEDVAVARDVILAEYTGARLHLCHISTRGAVEIVRAAKSRGVKVTAEAAPHHFTLTDTAVHDYDTSAKMNPPLRAENDRLAVIEGLKDGTLDVIATDHAPHGSLEKDCEFAEAQNGIIGLETALSLSLNLWRHHGLSRIKLIERLTLGPAHVLGLSTGLLQKGQVADITVIDPEANWRYDTGVLASKSRNSPFLNQTMQGRAVATLVAGNLAHCL